MAQSALTHSRLTNISGAKMSISDFLFNGQAPKSVTTYGSNVQNLPQWYNDFQQGIASKGNAIAAQPYEPYGAPRIAGFTQDQSNSFNLTRNGMGAESNSMFNSMNNATQAGNNADSLGDANPYMEKSNQNAYDTVGNYMNPYNEAVTNHIATLGARNLQENLMPAINSDFIRAGQYGSTNMMGEIGHALRDTNDDILAKQADVLQQGYGQSMNNAQADLSRYGQLGQTAGQLSNADSQMQLDSSKVSGALGQIAQGARYNDINALGAVGNSIQQQNQSNLDLAKSDFDAQKNYQADQLSWVNNLIKGYQMPTSSYTSNSAPLAGAQYQPSGASSALGAGLAAYGALK
jgi:hypothetical protein